MTERQKQIDPRALKAYEAVVISCEAIRSIHERLYPKCLQIAERSESASEALTMAWSVVDCVHRVRELAQSIPGLNARKNVEVRVLLDATPTATELRNYVQHMRGDLMDKNLLTEPVWGALSWIDRDDPLKFHTLMTGVILKGMQYPSPVFDTHKGQFLSRVTLTAKGLPIHIDVVAAACERFVSFMHAWVSDRINGQVEIRRDPQIFSGRLDFGTPQAVASNGERGDGAAIQHDDEV